MYQVCTACRSTPCHLEFDVDDSGILPEYCPFNVSLVPNWKDTFNISKPCLLYKCGGSPCSLGLMNSCALVPCHLTAQRNTGVE